MLKSDMNAATEMVGDVMLSVAFAETAPPLNCSDSPVLVGVGTTTTVTVAVEPACSD